MQPGASFMQGAPSSETDNTYENGSVRFADDNIWFRGNDSKWRKALLRSFDYTEPVLYHDDTDAHTGAQNVDSNWFQLPNTNCEIHAGGTGGVHGLARYLYRLPLIPFHGQKITLYNGATYVAFSQLYNNSNVKVMVKNSENAPSGGTAGNTAIKVTEGFCTLICRVRGSVSYWVAKNGEQVNRTTL